MTERLTTLQSVKDWLDLTDDGSDSSIVRLIDAASRFILTYLNRPTFQTVEHNDSFRGNGKDKMLLPHWPVISLTGLGLNGTSVPVSAAQPFGSQGSGYQLDPLLMSEKDGPMELLLWGYVFPYRAPCMVSYKTGFQAEESIKLAAVDGEIFANTVSKGQWIADLGVTIDGSVATKVDSDPTAGQYTVSEWGRYGFSIDDDDKIAIIAFNYVPWDVAFAITQLIGEWWKRKDRIGILSKTLGGQETVTFTQKDMTDSIRGMLNGYIRVTPG